MKKGFLMLAAALLALPLMLSGCAPQDSIGGETPAPRIPKPKYRKGELLCRRRKK